VFYINILFCTHYRLQSNKDVADIVLGEHLNYERNTWYSLTVVVQNKYQLIAGTEIDIEVLDVNDNIPVFYDITCGSVLEHEPPGPFVMQVQAIDADGTSANNQVLKFHKLHFTLLLLRLCIKFSLCLAFNLDFHL